MNFLEFANAIKQGSFEEKIYSLEEVGQKYRPLKVMSEIINNLNKQHELEENSFISYNFKIKDNTLILYHFGKQIFDLNKGDYYNDKNPHEKITIHKKISEKSYIQEISCEQYKLSDAGYKVKMPYTIQEYQIETIYNKISDKEIIKNIKNFLSYKYENSMLNYYQTYYHMEKNNYINNDIKMILLEKWQNELFQKENKKQSA